MNAFDCASSGARLTSWFHQLSNGNMPRPLKSSLSTTPTDGVVGVLGVLGPVGVVGSCESFAPPHAAIVRQYSASAATSIVRRFDVTRAKPSSGYRFASGADYSSVALQSRRMSDDERLVLVISAVLAVVLWGIWYIAPRRIKRLGRPVPGQRFLDVAPLVSLAVLAL